MLIDVVDTDVNEEGLLEGMASIALSHLARNRRTTVIALQTDTWPSLMTRIANASHGRGTIDILQVHSHGEPGRMFGGRLNEASIRQNRTVFAMLAPYFAPGGQAFLKGCESGQAPAFLRPLAEAWQVPVTAGVRIQFAGGPDHDLYVGRTVTAQPVGGMMVFDEPNVPRRAP